MYGSGCLYYLNTSFSQGEGLVNFGEDDMPFFVFASYCVRNFLAVYSVGSERARRERKEDMQKPPGNIWILA